MAKHYSKEARQLICDAFIQSGETQEVFAQSRKIGVSTLVRWLSERKRTRTQDAEKLKLSHPIRVVRHAAHSMESLQITLVNGVKINVPPHFCAASLQAVLSLLGADHA